MAPSKFFLLLLTPILLGGTTVLDAAQNNVQAPTPNSAVPTQPRLWLGNERVSNRLIVKYKAEGRQKVAAVGQTSGEARVRALNISGFASVVRNRPTEMVYLKSLNPQTHVVRSQRKLDRLEMLELVRNIAHDPQVESVEVDDIAYPQMTPNDTDYATFQWNLKPPADVIGGANLPTAWDTATGTGVVVAVVDTGYRPHADLAANIVGSYDFVSADAAGVFATANDGNGRDASALDPGDWVTSTAQGCAVSNSSWHGTHVAGVIAAVGNTAGIIGVAHGAKVLPVRVLGVCGGYTSDIIDGMKWAAGLSIAGVPDNTNVAKVINLSLGSTGDCSPVPGIPSAYQVAIDAVRGAGSVVVVSAGNSGASSLSKPANCNGVIAVTAHTKLGDRAWYANIGVGTALSAPGGGNGYTIIGDGSGIHSTINTGKDIPIADGFGDYAGTSFSAAHVSGVAALLYQIKPNIKPNAVETYLRNAARAFPAGTYCAGRTDCGAGMLDAFNAVNALRAAQSSALPNTVPVLTAIAAQTVPATSTLQFTVIGNDLDGDVVSFIASGLPVGATFNSVTGVFTWNNAQPMGNYTVTIQPTDRVALGAAQVVNITVTTAPPSPPSGGSGVGGGGGSVDWKDVSALLALSALGLGLRRYRARRAVVAVVAPRQIQRHPN